MSIFNQIVTIENIRAAYFEVIEKFEEKNKSYSYSGYDEMALSDYDFTSEEMFLQIQDELNNFKPINPSLELLIPKKNKEGTRPVYIHTIIERIKSQAVFRIVYPIFDEYFSHYLFSYRPSHPYHRALKTIVRRYHCLESHENILIGDIGTYSDVINPHILKEQIKNLNFDNATIRLLELYIDMPMLQQGEIRHSESGILTGLPITVMFNNLYLDAFDKDIAHKLSMYRRVGDDFIAFDTEDNLKEITFIMQGHLDTLKIPRDCQKIQIIKKTDAFGFLGYQFSDGVISLLAKSERNIKIYLRSRLRYSPYSSLEKRKRKFYKIFHEQEALKYYFIQIVRQYNHCNDRSQIQHLSDYFFVRLSIYFYGSYNQRNKRKTKKIIQDMNTTSLMRYYIDFHSGKYDVKKLKFM